MEMPPVWDAGLDDGAIVGGHCIVAWDYAGLADDATVRVATWGQWQPATWRWLAARLDEAYALLWGRELARADGVDLGVSDDVLDAELAAMALAA